MTPPAPRLAGHKIALFLTRSAGCAPADFTRRWLEAGEPAAPGLLGHVHNAPLDAEVPIENAPPAPFDGIAEFLFASAAEARAWAAGGALRDWLDARSGLLADRPLALSGQAWSVWQAPGEAGPDTIKVLTLPVRRPGMSMEHFAQHWIEVHARLALSGPGAAQRLSALHSCPADGEPLPGLAAAPFDGIGTIRFASRASLDAEFASSHYREVMAPDEPRFTDPARSRAMMVREVRL